MNCTSQSYYIFHFDNAHPDLHLYASSLLQNESIYKSCNLTKTITGISENGKMALLFFGLLYTHTQKKNFLEVFLYILC